jgi:uncharacterized protein
MPATLAALVVLATVLCVLALRHKSLKFGLLLAAGLGVLLGAIGFRDPKAVLFFGVALPIVVYIVRQSSASGGIASGADSGAGVSSSSYDNSSSTSSISSGGGGDFGGGGASGKW